MAPKKRALITGITGQDGSYLAELLLSRGYDVHGIKRRASSFNTERIDHIEQTNFTVHYGDMTDTGNLIHIFQRIQPDEVYNIAAQSHVQVSFEMPEYTINTSAMGTLRALEAIRLLGLEKKTKFYHASSSEMFGSALPPQNETTPFRPRSPYGVAKLCAHWITRDYRETYGMFAVNGILFNHESPRRGKTFVTRKVTRAVARIHFGLQDVVRLGNLNAKRDWGHAKDYVEAMHMMMQHKTPEDYVVATGEQRSVREFCEAAFREGGMEIQWVGKGIKERGVDKASGKVLVEIDPRYFRPAEVDALLGDSSKIRKEIGWKPKISFKELVKEMVEHDMEQASRMFHLKNGGFRTGNDEYEN
jgi:GDPmannose 4,6-dehydratase